MYMPPTQDTKVCNVRGVQSKSIKVLYISLKLLLI